MLLAGQIAGNLVFGVLADRVGHRLVLIAGAAAGVTANLMALGAPSIGAFAAVFALSGLQVAAVSISGLNVILEFSRRLRTSGRRMSDSAPRSSPRWSSRRPWRRQAAMWSMAAGFPWVFAVAAGGGLISPGLLIARVGDPRNGRES